MSKKRVHEIAKEQGLSSKELLEKLRAAGIEAKAAASSVEETLALKALSDGGAPAASNGADPAAGAGKDGKAPAKAASAKTDATEADAPAAEKTAPSAAPAPTGAKPSAPASAAAPSGSGPAGSAGSSASAPPPTAAPPAPQAPPGGERVRPTRDSRPGDVGPGGRPRVVIDSQASRRQQGGPANQPQRRPRRGRRRRGTYDETIAPIDTSAMEATDEIRVNSGSTVKDVAEYLGVPVPEIIKKLMTLGEMATLTQTLSDEAIQVLADEFEKKIEIVHAADDVEVEPAFEDAAEDLVERPPVVTIMG